MAKSQQRSTKEAKKPKKDSGSNAKPMSSDAPNAMITTVVPERGKKAKLK